MMKLLTRLLMLMFLTVGAAVASAQPGQPPGPEEQLRVSLEAVIQALQDETLSAAQRRQRIAGIIHERFDFKAMSQRALSTNWKKASPAERKAFVEKFSRLILASYMGRIEAYTDERVEFRGTRFKGDKAEVATVIITDTKEIPIRYRLRRKGEQWLVYDVVIEEVSLVRNYRSSYRNIVKKEGIDGLLARMDEKLNMLEGG